MAEAENSAEKSQYTLARRILRMIFSRENAFAVALCFIIILLLIVTSDSAPQWIYQGF